MSATKAATLRNPDLALYPKKTDYSSGLKLNDTNLPEPDAVERRIHAAN